MGIRSVCSPGISGYRTGHMTLEKTLASPVRSICLRCRRYREKENLLLFVRRRTTPGDTLQPILMSTERNESYFGYWGKAQPSEAQCERYHLLPHHCLDVAACGRELLRISRFSLARLSRELGWEQTQLEDLCIAFLAIHDIGKFARSFQNLAPDLSPALVPSDRRQLGKHRHDTLGWVACAHLIEVHLQSVLDYDGLWFVYQLARIFTGHHGKPPMEVEGASDPQPIRAKKCFVFDDLIAAETYTRDILHLFVRAPLPAITKTQVQILERNSWTLAGLAVLADWLGSDSRVFRYRESQMELSRYWSEIAVPTAQQSVASAGLGQQAARSWTGAAGYLHHLSALTPLQQFATSVPLGIGPQFFLLEEATGAGKTEAALLLCHRLMAGGNAAGFYFALPTMATANQMYRRVGKLYRGLFAADASPSLVLSHGAREMVEGFRESVLHVMPTPNDKDDLPRVGAQCNSWLADSRKKALLADAGVGTVDQALLSVLPVRHQSLRLLGLASKVLVVDEVHAYDDYTSKLLQTMVQAQAQQGGSVVLLSATVPASLRANMIVAFQQGIGDADVATVKADLRYPLATHVQASGVNSHACGTRQQMIRRVAVKTLTSEKEAISHIVCWAQEGRAVCWIRNTVEDARRSFALLQEHIDAQHAGLFHSRFAMGDRLRIEANVLSQFGSDSTPVLRRGRVLIATQVVEQSLDLDFDEMIVDLAPIDLVIQRAGRLHRHVRDAHGDATKPAGRPAPVLHVLAPVFTEEPAADWYKALFPKAAYVYEDHGQLWLTLRSLLEAKAIVTPGEIGEPGSVRSLVESVYGDDAVNSVPTGLWSASQKAAGRRRAESSLADYNVLNLNKGYCVSAGDWNAADKTPTRLGDEGRLIYLAREEGGELVPLLDVPRYAWEHSSVNVDLQKIDGLAPEWQTRFGSAIAKLQQTIPLLSRDAGALTLPLVPDVDGWISWCQSKGKIQPVSYDRRSGLRI